MTPQDNGTSEKTRRFQDASLPFADDAYRLAYFLLNDQRDAEDTVKNCYSRALHDYGDSRKAAIKAWLLTMIRNVCHAKLARSTEHKAVPAFADGQSLTGRPGSMEPIDSTSLKSEQGALLWQLLKLLPTELREAIVLREINNMSYAEISEITGAPIDMVVSRLARARALLLGGLKPANSTAARQDRYLKTARS